MILLIGRVLRMLGETPDRSAPRVPTARPTSERIDWTRWQVRLRRPMMQKLGLSLVLLVAAAAGASSQDVTPAAPVTPAAFAAEHGTRLMLLGTGGGPIIKEYRSQPANLIIVDGRPYLIDCGDGTVRQLKRAGFESPDVQRVFLTHLHIDHTSGLSSLMAYGWSSGKSKPMEIYGPPGTEAIIKSAFDYLSIPVSIHAAQFPPNYPVISQLIHAHDVDIATKKLIYQDDKVRVIAVENSHYATMHMGKQSYGELKSYAYRFETPDRTIVFTGDTGPSDAVADLALGADILVSEVINIDLVTAFLKKTFNATDQHLQPLTEHMKTEHLIPNEVGKLAAKAGVKLLVLSHRAPSEDSERSWGPYINDVSQFYKGPVVAGQDLDQF